MSLDSTNSSAIIKLRCSALDRIQACSASATPPSVIIDTPSAAGELGTKIHEWLADYVNGGDGSGFEGADEEFEILTRIGGAAWKKIAHLFPEPIVEHTFDAVAADGVTLNGTGDLISYATEKRLHGLDWKSGWADGEHEQQCRGYAWLAMNEDPAIESVRWHALRIRLGTVDVWEWTRDELAAWWGELVKRVQRRSEVYSPSPEACGFCPRFAECPARALMLRTALAVVANETPTLPVAIVVGVEMVVDPIKLANLVVQCRLVTKFADAALGTVRAVVINAGGSIPVGDGRELQIKSVVSTKIDLLAGYDTLRGVMSHDQILEASTIGKTKAVAAVRDVAPRGKKQEAEDKLLYELDKAGALKLSTSSRLELTKTKAIAGE